MNKEYLLDIIEEIEDLLSEFDKGVKDALLKDKINDLRLTNHGNMSLYFFKVFGRYNDDVIFEIKNIKQNIFDEVRTLEITNNPNKKTIIVFYSKVLEDLLELVEEVINNDSALEHYKKNVAIKSTDNSDKGPLGLYAFPDERPSEELPEELNTKLEDELWQELVAHFDENHKLTKTNFNKIQQLIKSKKYSDIFNFYRSGPIYRGMTVSKQLFKKLQKNFIYKPRAATSSWTWNESVAYDFSVSNTNNVSIVLKATSDKNNIENWLSARNLYKLNSISGYDNESEVIVLGDVTCEIIYASEDI